MSRSDSLLVPLTSNPAACTIVSNNYLAYARVFASSFLEHHPQGSVWVLIADRRDPEIDYAAEPFEVLFADQLGIPAFENFAFRYSILELNTAVKPYLLDHILTEHRVPALCYFDPDILVTGDLRPLYSHLRDSDLLLTPHILEPIDDDLSPSESSFLLSGIYNLGFVGFSAQPAARRFLEWWQQRLYDQCLHQVEKGLFVDQRWMDFGPAFVERATILRDPGYNVAYWNLMHRRLESDGRGWTIDGLPLHFFHFSGFQIDRPEAISKYQDRYRLTDRPDLHEIFDLYREKLLAAQIQHLGGRPYGYGRFSDGTAIPDLARQVLRRVDPIGSRWPDPFAADGRGSFRAWLAAPQPSARGAALPRIAHLLWDQRPDVQQAFPDPAGADADRFTRWFVDEARRTPGLAAFASSVEVEPIAPVAAAGFAPPTDAGGGDAAHPSQVASLIVRSGARHRRLRPSERSWLTADASLEDTARPRVPRLAMLLRQYRADVRGAFPDPLDGSRFAFAVWYVTYGRLEYRLPRSLVVPVLRSLPARSRAWAMLWWLRHARRRKGLETARAPLPANEAAPARSDDPVPMAGEVPLPQAARPTPRAAAEPKAPPLADGVTVVGWAAASTGIGEICRASVQALEEVHVPCSTLELRHPALDPGRDLVKAAPAGGLRAVSLLHVNADMLAEVYRRLPRQLTAESYRIGYWFWELAHFPIEFSDRFRLLDELWAPSRFCREAFLPLASTEVRWVPPAVVPPTPDSIERRLLGLPDQAFVFFFAFDVLSIPERKNPFGLLKAFAIASERSERPLHLVLKLNHSDTNPHFVKRLQKQVEGVPVTLLTRSLQRRELSSVMAVTDAYVSLHRSEGLGLPLIEAMYLRKPVIATGYGGCTDFLDETTGWTIDFEMVRLGRPQGPYPGGAVWAEPNPEHAAAAMVEVANGGSESQLRVERAYRRVVELYSPAAAGERFRTELERIQGQRPSLRRAVAEQGA